MLKRRRKEDSLRDVFASNTKPHINSAFGKRSPLCGDEKIRQLNTVLKRYEAFRV